MADQAMAATAPSVATAAPLAFVPAQLVEKCPLCNQIHVDGSNGMLLPRRSSAYKLAAKYKKGLLQQIDLLISCQLTKHGAALVMCLAHGGVDAVHDIWPWWPCRHGVPYPASYAGPWGHIKLQAFMDSHAASQATGVLPKELVVQPHRHVGRLLLMPTAEVKAANPMALLAIQDALVPPVAQLHLHVVTAIHDAMVPPVAQLPLVVAQPVRAPMSNNRGTKRQRGEADTRSRLRPVVAQFSQQPPHFLDIYAEEPSTGKRFVMKGTSNVWDSDSD